MYGGERKKDKEKKKKMHNDMIHLLGVDFDPYLVQADLVGASVSAHCYQHLKDKEIACRFKK